MRIHWLGVFLGGMAIGAADVVPGISGGTVAFLLGLYLPLLENMFRWKEGGWKFLSLLLGGAALSVCFLARFLAKWLHDPLSYSLLYAVCMGGIIGSLPCSLRRVPQWKMMHLCALGIGVMMTGSIATLSLWMGGYSSPWNGVYRDLWLFLIGALAVCATLLPGISGSTVLVLFGAYPVTIESLATFLHGDMIAIRTLLCLGLGIVFGAFRFVRVIRWLLAHYPQAMDAFLTGCLFGAWPTLWPFRRWSQGMPSSLYWPSFSTSGEQLAIILFLLAFATVASIEILCRKESADAVEEALDR